MEEAKVKRLERCEKCGGGVTDGEVVCPSVRADAGRRAEGEILMKKCN